MRVLLISKEREPGNHIVKDRSNTLFYSTKKDFFTQYSYFTKFYKEILVKSVVIPDSFIPKSRVEEIWYYNYFKILVKAHFKGTRIVLQLPLFKSMSDKHFAKTTKLNIFDFAFSSANEHEKIATKNNITIGVAQQPSYNYSRAYNKPSIFFNNLIVSDITEPLKAIKLPGLDESIPCHIQYRKAVIKLKLAARMYGVIEVKSKDKYIGADND